MKKRMFVFICILTLSFSLFGCHRPSEPITENAPPSKTEDLADFKMDLSTWPITDVDVNFIPLMVEAEGNEPVMIVEMQAVGDRIYIQHLPRFGEASSNMGVWEIESGREIKQVSVNTTSAVVVSDQITVLEATVIRYFDLDLNEIASFPLSQMTLDIIHGSRTRSHLSLDGKKILGTNGAHMPFIFDPSTDELIIFDDMVLPDDFEATDYSHIGGTQVPGVYYLIGHSADSSRTIRLIYDVEAKEVLQYNIENDSTEVVVDTKTAKIFDTGLGGYYTDCSLIVGPGGTVYDLEKQKGYALRYAGIVQVDSLEDKVVCVATAGNEAYIATFEK